MGIEKIACCYHRFTAYCIQNILLGASIIGFIFNIIGFAVIKWEFIPSGGELAYVACFLIYILSSICTSIIFYFRYKKIIHTTKFKISKNISFVNMVLGAFGIILSFITLIVCWVEYDDYKNYYINGEKAISGWNRFFMFVILGINSRCMGFLFFLWVSILIRIFKKTSGAYIVKENEYVVNNTTISTADNREVSINYGTRQVNLK